MCHKFYLLFVQKYVKFLHFLVEIKIFDLFMKYGILKSLNTCLLVLSGGIFEKLYFLPVLQLNDDVKL